MIRCMLVDVTGREHNRLDLLLKIKERWRWMVMKTLDGCGQRGKGVGFYNVGSYEGDCSGAFSRKGSWAIVIPHWGSRYGIKLASYFLQPFHARNRSKHRSAGNFQVYFNQSRVTDSYPLCLFNPRSKQRGSQYSP